MIRMPHKLTLFILTCFLSPALADVNGYKLGISTGMLTASLGGDLISSFAVAPIWHADYEIATTMKSARFFSATFASDMATAQTKYFGFGAGQRSFLWGSIGKDALIANSTGNGDMLRISSRHRFFWDWSLGLGQLQSYLASLSLNLTSTVFSANGGLGYEYQMLSNTALISKLQMGYGYGISSVAVSAMLIQINFGATMSF